MKCPVPAHRSDYCSRYYNCSCPDSYIHCSDCNYSCRSGSAGCNYNRCSAVRNYNRCSAGYNYTRSAGCSDSGSHTGTAGNSSTVPHSDPYTDSDHQKRPHSGS